MQINLSNLKINYIDHFSKKLQENFGNPIVQRAGLACLLAVGLGVTIYLALGKIKRMAPTDQGYWKNRLLAAMGNALAHCNLGKWYENEGVAQTRQVAYENYLQSALKGNSEAQFKLARCFIHGWGCGQNIAEAVKYYILAADGGYLAAQKELAQMYSQGIHVSKDSVQALKYFKLSTVQRATPDDYYQMGILYKATKDVKQASQSFKAGADLGLGHAQFEYALLRLKEDEAESAKYFEMAAAQGIGWAYCYLGDMQGEKDPKALEYYLKGRKLKCGEATYRIADFYFESDRGQYFKYMCEAAKQGHAEGQCDLAAWYESRGNQEKALKYYKLAAAQGHQEAQNKVQELSQRGPA